MRQVPVQAELNVSPAPVIPSSTLPPAPAPVSAELPVVAQQQQALADERAKDLQGLRAQQPEIPAVLFSRQLEG